MFQELFILSLLQNFAFILGKYWISPTLQSSNKTLCRGKINILDLTLFKSVYRKRTGLKFTRSVINETHDFRISRLLPSESRLSWLEWELYREPESEEWRLSLSVLLEHTLHLKTHTQATQRFHSGEIRSGTTLTPIYLSITIYLLTAKGDGLRQRPRYSVL